MNWQGILFALALGLLAHSFIGYAPFPFGDDFAYAPLTEIRLDPSLFPRDEQLRMFSNHALVYEAIYRLGLWGPGVEPVFRIAVWVLAGAVAVAVLAILRRLGAPAWALPVVVGLGVVVALPGLGRGHFGGLISPFFHHHNVALALVLGAVAMALARRVWLAGILLGVAAYAQPMTAFHGAAIVGLGALFQRPGDTLPMAAAAIGVAIPAAIPILGSMIATSDANTQIDLIQDAYRFRSPAHYDPPWSHIGLTSLYLLAGWAGAALMLRTGRAGGRFAVGAMAALTALHLVTLIVYKWQITDWVGFFILDATRSSSLGFVLGPVFAIAAVHDRLREPVALAMVALLAALAVLNGVPAGMLLLALGIGMIFLDRVVRARQLLAIGLATSLVLLFPARPLPPPLPESSRIALERIRTETPVDALFVIPVSLMEFRHYAQRSAYVDFKLFSVAQPEQAALTRTRIDQVTRPAPDVETLEGWLGAQAWDEATRRAATCEYMEDILNEVGAEYYVRPLVAGEAAPQCDGLPSAIQTETLAIYGPVA
ncbi:DUF6798 domain-containing protein [Jannaschia aquimarina]|uniref:DUF6798 domain-containing protein n=1 Tax=Jannaschia aquimarina TaxID=935700 RepID=A0A0D1DAS3_9RHOB|nr:DUF6798 domain-containing protein [Jannaschia aquimarina]KIT17043.1 hypothetical protein jaqu_12330 [Jannaschia aquimarina]SNS82126.1 hypothetical protein SAMN05421775_102436 [Jannaschia aquimarina]